MCRIKYASAKTDLCAVFVKFHIPLLKKFITTIAIDVYLSDE